MAQNFAERLGWIPKSEDLRMSMGRALNFAQERKHTEVTLEHFLLALIDDPNASAVFAASEINTERLRDEIEVYVNQELQHLAALGEGMAQPSESFKKVMAHASAAAEQSQREVIDGAIVLAALIGEGQSEAALILNNHGMTFDVVVNSLKNSNAAAQQQQAQQQQHPQHQRQEAPPQQRPEPVRQQPHYQEPDYQEPVQANRQPESSSFENDLNSGMSDQYAATAPKEEIHHGQAELDRRSPEPDYMQPSRENPLNGSDQPAPEMRPAANPKEQSPDENFAEISPQSRPEPQVQIEADNAALKQSGPAPAKRNIFDQRAYAAPEGVQRPEVSHNNPAGGLQDAYPQTGSQTGSGNLAQQAEAAEQPEKENISREATVDDILASVREIIGVENSEQETIQPLGDQLNAEKDEALKKSLDKTDDLKNEAFGQLKDVAKSVAEEQAASMLDDVYPSDDAEETDENIDLDFPQPKPDLGEAAKSVGKGLQDRLKEKSPFQSAEELAKNWPGTGKDKAATEEAEQKPIVHENPFQPDNRPDNRPDKPNVPPHQQPPARGQQPPPSAQAQEQKKGAMPPPQGQPLNQPPKQSAAPSGDKKAADQKGPAQQQPGPDAAQKGKPQQPGQQMPPPGQQPPPHRGNMPPPPPGQQPGGNMPGQPPHHRPHPQQQPPQGYPGGKAGPGGPGGPMPVPPPPGAPMQGQRGAPPPHLAGQQPPQGRRPGGDPRMEGRPPQGAEGQGQQRNIGTKGQLIENIPRIMRMGIPVQIEVRMARADVQEIERGMMGNNPPARHDVIVTEAMSVRLSAPKGGFNIAPASPETQWIDNRLGGDNYASWKWTITPLKSGKKVLQLGISARLMGEKGVIAQSALPEQLVTVKVKVNYARTLRIFIGWLIVAAAGGVIGKYSERLVELIDMIPGV